MPDVNEEELISMSLLLHAAKIKQSNGSTNDLIMLKRALEETVSHIDEMIYQRSLAAINPFGASAEIAKNT
jgi:hypothetical protein